MRIFRVFGEPTGWLYLCLFLSAPLTVVVAVRYIESPANGRLNMVMAALPPTNVGTLTHDPQETCRYRMEWAAALGTDTIVDSTWEVEGGNDLSIVSEAIVVGNRATSVVLTGGTARKTYFIRNTIVTASGQTWQRTGLLAVRQR